MHDNFFSLGDGSGALVRLFWTLMSPFSFFLLGWEASDSLFHGDLNSPLNYTTLHSVVADCWTLGMLICFHLFSSQKKVLHSISKIIRIEGESLLCDGSLCSFSDTTDRYRIHLQGWKRSDSDSQSYFLESWGGQADRESLSLRVHVINFHYLSGQIFWLMVWLTSVGGFRKSPFGELKLTICSESD